MNRTRLVGLIFFLMMFIGFPSFAGAVKKGFEALQVHDYFKAKESFTKGMKYSPQVSAFGLASLYTRDNNVFFSRDSAYKYIHIAKSTFGQVKASKRKKYVKYGWTEAGIDSLERVITQLFYAEAQRINTPASYNAYLSTHPNSIYSQRALELRDSLAFFQVVMQNTSAAYQDFLTTYPNSEYRPIAEDNFYELQFSEGTGDGTLASYLEFIELNPNSPLKPSAERKIFEIVTEAHTSDAYDVFIRTYPKNSMVDSAWRQLYQSSLDTFSLLTIKRFKSKYPNYPFQKELLRDMEFIDSVFLPAKGEEGFGYMNTAGILMIPIIYEQVSDFKEGLAVVAKDGKFGVIDHYNRTRIPFVYDAISDFVNGRAIVELNGKQGMIHRNGTFVLDCEFEDMGVVSNGLIYATKGEKFGYYDAKGFLRIPMKFDDAYDFSNGIAKVEVDGLEAFIDIYGGYVVPPAFEEIRLFSDSLYVYESEGLYGFINRLGKVVIEAQYTEMGEPRNGFVIALLDSEVVYLNTQAKVVIQNDFEEFPNYLSKAEFVNDEAIAMKKGLYGKIDKKGREVLKFQYENLGMGTYIFPFEKGDLWGVMNASGKTIVQPIYTELSMPNDQFIVAQTETGEGVLSATGAVILPMNFRNIEHVVNDIFVGVTDDGAGVFRKSELLVRPEYDSVQPFGKDYLLLSKGNLWSYVQLSTGKLIEMNMETGE